MKLFKLPLLACIITILAISCEKGPDTNSNGNTDEPVTESGEGYSVTYKYKDGVIVFDETSSHYVKEIISDTIVVFSHSIPDDLTPRVGDIISSRVYPEIPYGLGNRVLSIQKEGDGYRCVTTPAALEDIFSDLIINSEFALPLEDEDTKVSFSPILNLDLNKEYKDHVKISGGVDLGVVFTCNVDLKARKFEISLKFSTELDCGVSVYAGLPDELKKWYPFPNKTIFRNVVEIGPVVLHPYLDFRPYLSFDLEGSVDIIEFQKKSSWTVGIKDGKAFQEKSTENADISNIIKNLEIDAKGEIALNLPFIFGLGVYTKGIAVELQPTAAFAFGADCQLLNPNLFIEGPELTFEARIDTYAAAFVRIFGKEFFGEQGQLASLSLFKKEWPLLPRLVDETFNVIEFSDDESDPDDEETGADSLAFVANYALDPGLLCRFMDIEAGFGVYEGGNEVYHLFNESRIEPTQTNKYAYKLGKLKYNTIYFGCPSIRIGNTVYNGNGIEFISEGICPDSNHPHMIDLGLPSGIHWCCCNLGANSPEEYGEFFSWEDISNIKNGRLPNKDEIKELVDNCVWTLEYINNVYGIQAKGPNGNSIFFPFTGYFDDIPQYVYEGISSRIWGSSTNEYNESSLLYLTSIDTTPPTAFPDLRWCEPEVFKYSIRLVKDYAGDSVVGHP